MSDVLVFLGTIVLGTTWAMVFGAPVWVGLASSIVGWTLGTYFGKR